MACEHLPEGGITAFSLCICLCLSLPLSLSLSLTLFSFVEIIHKSVSHGLLTTVSFHLRQYLSVVPSEYTKMKYTLIF